MIEVDIGEVAVTCGKSEDVAPFLDGERIRDRSVPTAGHSVGIVARRRGHAPPDAGIDATGLLIEHIVVQ